MNETPIPLINYIMVGITSAMLAYVTAMEKQDDNDNSNAPEPEPEQEKEPEPDQEKEPEPESEQEQEKEPEPEPEPEPEQEPKKDTEYASQTDIPVAIPVSNSGGKHSKKHLKQSHHKTKTNRQSQINSHRKQTRNKKRHK